MITIARNDHPHNKTIYVRTSDYGLWNKFVEKYGEQKSKVIMSLIREHMKGEPDKP